jgi:hypothetical protein
MVGESFQRICDVETQWKCGVVCWSFWTLIFTSGKAPRGSIYMGYISWVVWSLRFGEGFILWIHILECKWCVREYRRKSYYEGSHYSWNFALKRFALYSTSLNKLFLVRLLWILDVSIKMLLK